MRKHTSLTVAALSLIMCSVVALAGDLKITVDEVKVYKDPNPSSEVVTTLFKGDMVKVSNRPIPNYQKVQVLVGGQKQIGYIKNSDLAGGAKGPAAGRKMVVRGGRRPGHNLRNHFSVGVFGGINYESQGTRSDPPDSSGNFESYAVMSGVGTVFGLGAQIPFTSRISAKVYFEIKNASVTGTGALTSGGVTGASSNVFLVEQYMGGGVMGQYYISPLFWAGAGAEYDHPTSGTVQVAGGATTTPPGLLVDFFYLYGAAGFDFEIGHTNVFAVPEIRVGSFLSTPLILEGDALINISYAF